MVTQLPPSPRADDLAARDAQYSCEITLAKMGRLALSTVTPPDTAQVDWQFGLNAAGRPACWGEVSAWLSLTCQRCLEPTSQNVVAQTQVEFVATVDDVARAHGFEPVIADDGRVDTLGLIEDELLLALPIAPNHTHACGDLVNYSSEPTGETRVRPFAGLDALIAERAPD
jgi:uncharacterized protein